MNTNTPWTRILLSAAALAFVPGAATAVEEAEGVLRRASAAMGASDLKTIRYAGSGTGATFGQAYKPGGAWPKLNYSTFSRVADYENGALREDWARSRGEPSGGGATPHTGEQKLAGYLSGTSAWNVAGPAPAPAAVAVAGRIHDLWTTPHGVIKAALKNKATLTWRTEGGKEYAAASFTEPGRYSATALINAEYLVERVDSRMPNTVLGDTLVVTTYSDYRDYGGVKFPARIRQSAGGFPVLDIEVKEVQPNAKADIQVPENVRAFAENVTSEKAADGVWYLAGGSHHSVAIEMKDYIVVVESPLYDGRAAAMLEAAGKLVPGKRVRYVVNSHDHFDHAGGLRTAAAAGATLIVHGDAKPWFDRVLANPNRISPDRLAKSGKKARVEGVKGKRVLSDGSRTIEIHPIQGSVHSNGFLLVYLPKEKFLIEADAFTPPPPNAPAPATPNPNNVNLADNIARLNLPVERILPLHGRIVPVAELNRVIGRK